MNKKDNKKMLKDKKKEKPDEDGNFVVSEHLLIKFKDTGKVIYNGRS